MTFQHTDFDSNLEKRMEIEYALFSSDTRLERGKAPTNFARHRCVRYGAKLKILCYSSENRLYIIIKLYVTFKDFHCCQLMPCFRKGYIHQCVKQQGINEACL